jgi:two-component system chemotaxis response regulator CheV
VQKQEILLESGTNEMELMTFLLGDQKFGMNVAKIQSILQYDPETVTTLPMTHAAMMGVMLYRDRTIPLIDMATAINSKIEAGSQRQIVMVTEFNNSVNGFLVDGVDRIHRLKWNDFVPIDDIITTFGENVIGSVHVDADDVLVIDMERILANIFPDLVIEELTEETINKQEGHLNRGDIRIFFAEDSKPIRDTVARSLKKVGFTNLHTFENGRKAFDTLVAESKKSADSAEMPHLVLSDIEMPQMDGLTLCSKIRKELNLKKLPFIVFSSLINDQMIVKCQDVGATAYVTKPEMNKLIAMLDELTCEQ